VSKVSLNISAFIFLLLGFFGMPARAILFDWDQTGTYATWAGAGNDPAVGATATRNFNNDAFHAGNDVTISIQNLNNGSSGFAWTGDGMSVDDDPTTGGLPAAFDQALQYEVGSGNNLGIRTTITFNYTGGVRNLTFTLMDVDRQNGSWIDQISGITATPVGGGAPIAATSVVGTAGGNVVAGNGTTGATATGSATISNTTNGANVTITFGNTPISSVTFTWINTDAGQDVQYIALGDLNYSAVLPEVGTSMAALGACLGVTLIRRRRPLAV